MAWKTEYLTSNIFEDGFQLKSMVLILKINVCSYHSSQYFFFHEGYTSKLHVYYEITLSVWHFRPPGVFEFENFKKGTVAVMDAVVAATQRGATTIIGR